MGAGKHRSHYRSVCGLSFAHAHGEPPPLQSQLSASTGTAPVSVVSGTQSFASRSPQQVLPMASPHLYSKGYPRLFSVGEDRRLVEYDVPNSFEHTGEHSALLSRASRPYSSKKSGNNSTQASHRSSEQPFELNVQHISGKAKLRSYLPWNCVRVPSMRSEVFDTCC